MKKVLLAILCLVSISFVNQALGQACVTINDARVSGEPASRTIIINYSNPSSGNKSINVSYKCGSGPITSLGCYSASGAFGDITTNAFSCEAVPNDIFIIITPFTGNGCGGQRCADVYFRGNGEPSNAALPVKFSSVAASRNKSTVSLIWATASESNNKGFNVQRNTAGVWENIAFVFSKTTDGNSSSNISYSFNDVNANKNVTQYRLQQVDINGRSEYSEIRSVRGEEMSSKMLVFPNPSNTGKLSLVFDDASAKNVQVMDLNGRLVRQLKNVSNTASIDGLENGVYSIRVSDVATNLVSVEKVVIRK